MEHNKNKVFAQCRFSTRLVQTDQFDLGAAPENVMVAPNLNITRRDSVGGNREGKIMSGSVNKVILVGNLGADPDIRNTQDGRPIVNLSIATSESWRDRNSGERREKTEWHRVVIFNEGLARVAEQYLRKGSKVYLEGQLQTRKWQDQSGQDRYSTEVVLQGFNSNLTMLDGRSGGEEGGFSGPRVSDNNRRPSQAPSQSAPAFDAGGQDDDIPF